MFEVGFFPSSSSFFLFFFFSLWFSFFSLCVFSVCLSTSPPLSLCFLLFSLFPHSLSLLSLSLPLFIHSPFTPPHSLSLSLSYYPPSFSLYFIISPSLSLLLSLLLLFYSPSFSPSTWRSLRNIVYLFFGRAQKRLSSGQT